VAAGVGLARALCLEGDWLYGNRKPEGKECILQKVRQGHKSRKKWNHLGYGRFRACRAYGRSVGGATFGFKRIDKSVALFGVRLENIGRRRQDSV